MTRKSWLFPAALAVLMAAAEAAAQRASDWRVYKIKDGMPTAACSSITVGPHGFVWVRHASAQAITELDGYELRVTLTPGHGADRVYASPGGLLWSLYPDGLQ